MTTSENLFMGTVQAQESNPAGAQPKGGVLGMFAPMILVFVIFYFLMIRPQSKQRKKHQEMLGGLKKGDEVITSAGIHGKIAGVADNIATVEIADNVRVKMDKAQIITIKPAA